MTEYSYVEARCCVLQMIFLLAPFLLTNYSHVLGNLKIPIQSITSSREKQGILFL